MTGADSVIILLCLVLSITLITIAWWISGINTVLVRLTVGQESRHLERTSARAADKRMSEVRQKQFFLWLVETASTLKALHGIAEKFGNYPGAGVATSPPQPSDAPLSEPAPSTVQPSRQADQSS